MKNKSQAPKTVALTADGKLVVEPSLLTRWKIQTTGISFHSLSEEEASNLYELKVIVLPIIAGEKAAPTMTENFGNFFKTPIEFSLKSKRVKNQVAYLLYSASN